MLLFLGFFSRLLDEKRGKTHRAGRCVTAAPEVTRNVSARCDVTASPARLLLKLANRRERERGSGFTNGNRVSLPL